jgi:multiple sugar transport system permease protein
MFNMPYYVKKRVVDIVISIIMLMFLALTLLPIGWMVFSSLKSSTDIAIGRVGLSHNLEGKVELRWSNYVDMWKNVNFGLYLKNSIIICGATMFFAMVFSTLAAYALSRFRFPGSDLFSNATLATQMIPAIMYLIPIYIMFVKFTLLTGIPVKGTYWGIILIYSAFFLPFSIWILRGFFASIPNELEEAARIDGCSAFQVFWYIALPLAIPGIIATGIYIFLTAWDELMFAWVLTNADTMTIPVGIRLFVGNYQNRFDLMMAAATVATIPVVVLFFLLQRHIVRGLTAGAVKG